MKTEKKQTKNGRAAMWSARLLSLGLAGLMCLSAVSCSAWNALWIRYGDADVNSDLLVIPGSGGSEDTFVPFEGAVDYTGEPHEGADIYYVGKGENRERVIVIAAGHQAEENPETEPIGPDSEKTAVKMPAGGEGKYAGPEHVLNLEVALLLRDVLIERGYSVVMIRETAEVDVSEKERAEIANRYQAAAYVRIHANISDDTDVSGARTVCQSEKNPFPDCAALYSESRSLSEAVLRAFEDAASVETLDILETDDLTGTNWAQVPTTVVEMGYLSNTSDDMLMALPYFKEQAALGIADGLEDYFALVDAAEGKDTGDEGTGDVSTDGDATERVDRSSETD